MITIKIAMVSPLNFATNKRSTGSVEFLTSALVRALVNYEDIEVTLFASGDSDKVTELVPVIDKGFGRYCHEDINKATLEQIQFVKSRASEFDIIHSHLPIEDTAKILGSHRTPIIKTLHGAIIKQCNEIETKKRIEEASKISFLTPVSNSLRINNKSLTYTETVYNGIPMENFNFNSVAKGDEKGEYWAFMGRLNPVKGVHYAIQTALFHGKRLKIAGMKSNKSEEKYFAEYIEPYLGEQIEYVGVVGSEKSEFLCNARLVLAPSCCEEAFGLVVIEALACGTPVICSKRGAFPEIIQSGQNGYLVPGKNLTIDLKELIKYAPIAEKLDRSICRMSVINRFTVQKMTEDYVKVYREILKKGN
ncbi:MAG: glycosyltransferase [Filifactoraceae bacterium]